MNGPPEDALIPEEIHPRIGRTVCSGLTIPEEFGGLGLPKVSIVRWFRRNCRAATSAWGFRGHAVPRDSPRTHPLRWHRRTEREVAAGPRSESFSTAVFTEPNTSSDLGALNTRAKKDSRRLGAQRQPRPGSTHTARTPT